MIIDLVLGVLFGILNAVLGLIPEFTLFDGPEGGMTTDQWSWAQPVADWLRIWDLFMPISVMFVCIVAVVAARVFVVLVQFIQWLWSVLPFKSS